MLTWREEMIEEMADEKDKDVRDTTAMEKWKVARSKV